MAKELVSKTGGAAVESLLRQLMPQLQQSIAAIQSELRDFRLQTDRRFDHVEQEIQSRHERAIDAMNELGQRIAKVEGKLEVLIDSINGQTARMEHWIERVVSVERSQTFRRRKAG
jgi:ABC-type phosphate transport system auxiliary subunit